MSADHALLAPSAAHRWMTCPGSVRLTEGRDDGGSVYSREGTAAHLLARHCLERGTDADAHLGRVIGEEGFTSEAADGNVRFAVSAEMADAVQIYIDAARPYLDLEDHLIEAKLAAPIENCFGTLDFAAYDPSARRLTVIDFKFGQGVVVEVQGNKQLLTYAAALLPGCDAVDEVELVIVQPRRLHAHGPVRQWVHTPQELEAHVVAARRAAALIEHDPPILNAGDHCRFCRATSFCPAFLAITPNDRAPERSQPQASRGNQTESENDMSKFKDQIIDASNKPGTAVAKPGDNPWLTYGEAAGTRTFNGDLLKFSKGDYTAGQNNRAIAIGTRLVANMDSLEVGWVRWEDSRPIEQRMGAVVERFKPARRNELGDSDSQSWEIDETGRPRDPWQFTNTLELASEDGGELYTFSTSSKGGIGAIGELCKAFGEEVNQHPDEWPVIELGVDSYAHSNKNFGRIKFPTFKIIGWARKDGEAPAPPPPKLAPKPSNKPAATARF
jgi:hypothetical protein